MDRTQQLSDFYKLHGLTQGQIDVAIGIFNGERVRITSERLGITEKAVKGRRTRIYKALGVANAGELRRKVVEQLFLPLGGR